MKSPIEFRLDNDEPVITYTSPSRQFGNLREELNNDAVRAYNKYGPCYLAYSSGIDSQIILRSWLDMNCEVYPFFVYYKGYNSDELEAVKYSEKFYGIKIEIIEVDIEEHRTEWEQQRIIDNIPSLTQYPFQYASKQLKELFPVVLSGPSEPCPIGIDEHQGTGIYHHTDSTMIMRCNMLGKHREVLDFPYSPASLASYYCDDIMKAYVDSARFFVMNGLLKDGKPLEGTTRYEYYAKPLLKARYYKKDIFYPSKKTGLENVPNWMIKEWELNSKYRVTAPYWDVVKHLESCDGSIKEYRDWMFK